MLAILAEDDSDADVLTHLVRRRLSNEGLRIKRKGYCGCGELCRKGFRDIKSWIAGGLTSVIVCHDADAPSPDVARRKVQEAIIAPSRFEGPKCIAVPVQEMEAWIIADEDAINAVIPSFQFKGHRQPETISSPKEWLVKQSRASNGKPLYSSTTFNPAVARNLRFETVSSKCPSFKIFLDWIDRHLGCA